MRKSTRSIPLLAVAALTLWTIASEAWADASYKDYIQVSGARYYWNWDDGSFVQPNLSANNLGAAAAGLLTEGWAPTPVVGTSNARGLSLGNAASYPNAGAHENWYTWDTTNTFNDATYTRWAAEFWVNVDPTITGVAVIGVVFGTPTTYFAYDTGTGKIKLQETQLKAISAGSWHHVVLANDGTTATAILDGDVAGKSTASLGIAFDATSASYLRIGSWNGVANNFKGMLDEFAIYNLSALSPSQYDAKLEEIARHWNIPEPSAVLLLLGGGLLLWRRHRRG